jgi:hypothetical protein
MPDRRVSTPTGGSLWANQLDDSVVLQAISPDAGAANGAREPQRWCTGFGSPLATAPISDYLRE